MAEPTTTETHVEMANVLLGRLVAIFLVAFPANSFIFSGTVTFPERLVALCFVLVVVLASRSKLVDAKLERFDERPGQGS